MRSHKRACRTSGIMIASGRKLCGIIRVRRTGGAGGRKKGVGRKGLFVLAAPQLKLVLSSEIANN